MRVNEVLAAWSSEREAVRDPATTHQLHHWGRVVEVRALGRLGAAADGHGHVQRGSGRRNQPPLRRRFAEVGAPAATPRRPRERFRHQHGAVGTNAAAAGGNEPGHEERGYGTEGVPRAPTRYDPSHRGPLHSF